MSDHGSIHKARGGSEPRPIRPSVSLGVQAKRFAVQLNKSESSGRIVEDFHLGMLVSLWAFQQPEAQIQ